MGKKLVVQRITNGLHGESYKHVLSPKKFVAPSFYAVALARKILIPERRERAQK